jgi:uronate dehydrogenase
MTEQLPALGTWAITGAAGNIGRLLRHALRGRVERLRLLDIRPIEVETLDEAAAQVDLRDLSNVCAALAGIDGVVHLGGIADEADFDELLDANVRGTYHVLEASRRARVQRVVFASSNHVTGCYPSDARVDVDMPVRPDGFYGVSKAAGEALARVYADKFGLAVACIRIGSSLPQPTEPRHRHTWLSERDTIAAFLTAMSAPDLTFATFYGASANDLGWWDSAAAERLGFRPEDDAGRHLSETFHGLQGGPFASPEYTLSRQRP